MRVTCMYVNVYVCKRARVCIVVFACVRICKYKNHVDM